MTTYRLRIKIGESEFESEAPDKETLAEHLSEFKTLLASPKTSSKPKDEDNGPAVVQRPAPTGLETLFSTEERDGRTFVSLRFAPQGETRAPTSLLLILYGYKALVGQDEVPVTALTGALAQSGVNVDRVDREAVAPLQHDSLILRTGIGKGTRYRLTNAGLARAETEAQRIVQQMA